MRSITRWEPFAELEPIEPMFHRFFGDLRPFRLPTNGETEYGYFPMDIAETDEGYELTASLPGAKPEEVEIQVHGSTVTIKGQMKEETEHKGKYWLRRERRSGTFARSLTLPTEIVADKTTAAFEHGVLKLYLAKSEAVKPKTIKVGGVSK